MVYAMTGGNGSGKTTFALKFAEETGAYFFHLSDEEFDRHNQEDPQPPPAEVGIKVLIRNNFIK